MLTSVCWNMEFGLCPWRVCVVGMISKACNQPVSCWARQTGNICMWARPCNQHMGCEAAATTGEWRHISPWFKENKVNHAMSVSKLHTHVHKQAQIQKPRSNKKQVHGSFFTETDKQNQIYTVWTDGIIHSGFPATHKHTRRKTGLHTLAFTNKSTHSFSYEYYWPKQPYESDRGYLI